MPLSHAARSLGLRHNPLRRRVDVVEGWLLVVMVLALTVASPLLGAYAGTRVYASEEHGARVATQSSTKVNAILLEDTASYTPAANFSTTVDQIAVKAQWIGPDAMVHVARITPAERGRAGATVPVWVDSAGNPVTPPLRHDQIVEKAVGLGTSAVFGLATLLVALWLCARHAIHRRRMSYWHLAWAAVEPQWSGRR
jgi:hypothetical protein